MDLMSAEDYALALKLQAEFDATDNVIETGASSDRSISENSQIRNGILERPSTSKSSSYGNEDTSQWTLVDKRWEIIDPIPDIRALFLQFNEKYFWGKLAGIEVRWSPRMTLCAGLCVYQGRAGYCSVRLSEPLLKLRPRKDFIETLLHEMIHAYLFVTDNNRDHDGHGPEFHKHMYRLNAQCGTNISVYHTFHDEVDNYRTHWWKCEGPCQKKPPYFGMVKRAMNRAPSPRDPWWGEHQQSCGGTYTKVKEPDGYKDKNKQAAANKEKKAEDSVKSKGNMDIRVFGGKDKLSDPGVKEVKPTSWDRNNDPGDGPNGKSSSGSKSGALSGSAETETKNGSNSVKGNIHGFTGKDSDDTKNFHGNIHGFSASTEGKNGEGGGSMAGAMKPAFTGQGKTLGSAGSSGPSTGPIIRQIPGIGIITTERQTSLGSSSADYPTSNDQVLGNVETVEAQNDSHGIAQAESNGTSENGALRNGGMNKVIDYDSDESDFDDALDRILKKDSDRVLKRKQSESNLGQGRSKTPKGFTSVCNPRRHSDPSRWKRSENDPPYKVGDLVNDRPTNVKLPVKRKFSGGESRAVDRNKRACYISSSESDSDINEGATLGSFTKNQKNYAELESDRESDSDSMDSTITGAISGRILSDTEDSISNGASSDVVALDNSPPQAVANETEPNTLRECPVCFSEVPETQMNGHLDVCLLGGGW